MDTAWFYEQRYEMFGHFISIAGIAACVAMVLFGIGLSLLFQTDKVRHLLTRLGLDRNLVSIVTAVVELAILGGSIIAGLNLAGLPMPWEAPVPGVGISVGRLVRLVVMLVVVIWLVSIFKRVLFNRYLSRMGADRSLQHAVAQICGYVALVVGIFVVLQNAGVELSALAIFAGGIGVGIGLGLQSVTSNFISGLVVLAERPIRIGDRVEVDGVAGQVVAIRARSTTILTNDNIAMIVPNSHFIEKTVTNWSHGDPKVRIRIPVGVAYGSDVERVCDILKSVAEEHPAAVREPPPTVLFDGFGESALNFELAVWTAEMSIRPRRFRSDLNFAIERNLREAGVEIPFPQREVRVRSVRSETSGREAAEWNPATLSSAGRGS